MTPKPALEWICATTGGVLTLATLAIIAAEIPGSDTAPQLRIEVGATLPSGSGYVVMIEVINTADMTAAGVEIEGTLADQARAVETRRVTLDYVPRNSSTRAGLLFAQDPSVHRLDVRAIGYQDP